MSIGEDQAAASPEAAPWTGWQHPSGPVARIVLPNGMPVWLVTSYEDAMAALIDSRLSKNVSSAAPEIRDLIGIDPAPSILNQQMNLADPPDHTRLRKLVSKAFTPRRVAHLESRIQEITDSLLDEIAPRGQAELRSSFISPLVSAVLYEMLGVPFEDRADFEHYTEAFVGLSNEASGEAMAEAAGWFDQYLTGLVARLREEPGDDLLSAMIQVQEQDGGVTDLEIRSTVMLLLVAGAETTINLLSNGILALVKNPAQLAALRADPELVPGAVEELLRFTSPVSVVVHRFATEDLTIGDAKISTGDNVLVSLAAANRDQAKFSDPDVLDLTRQAGGHVAFGHGIHFCIGAPLARLKGQIGLATLLRRFDNLELTVPVEELTWAPSVVANSLDKLPVTFTAR
jgi:cytochrome P450